MARPSQDFLGEAMPAYVWRPAEVIGAGFVWILSELICNCKAGGSDGAGRRRATDLVINNAQGVPRL